MYHPSLDNWRISNNADGSYVYFVYSNYSLLAKLDHIYSNQEHIMCSRNTWKQ